ncbi:MAG TPA: flagellar protein FliT, partial [Burkholderiales bacterium]|nr:flagellar protein FliT [Burkholderiales bacterium]
MSGKQVIAVYERVLAESQQMVEAARASDWERLVALERRCSHIVATLAGRELRETLEPALQRRKAEIIRNVLAADAEIRNITEPWMQQLQHILGSAARTHRLREAYA